MVLRSIFVSLAHGLFYVLNRRSLHRFNSLIYDFALRCNGLAINFSGQYGITAGEERFLQRSAARFAEGVVLDVGANAGGYAQTVRKFAPKARVIAFEPHPKTFQELSRRGEKFGFQAVNLALSDEPGSVEIFDFASKDGSTLASLNPGVLGFYRDVSHYATGELVSHSVESTTIDFLKTNGIDRVALLKVDTEGLDIKVLKGAANAIAEDRIDMIQFEFVDSNVAARVFMKDFFDALPGYEIHRICLNGDLMPLFPYDSRRCEIYVPQNIIAIRKQAWP